MDYHIVPNLTSDDQEVRKRSALDLHDWHFEATLFGAGMLILLFPLASTLFPSNRPQQVLGAKTEQVTSKLLYDSEYGYYLPQESQQATDFFSSLVQALLSLFK